MPDRESDLLFGLLALQLGFVTRDHLLEAVAVWTGEGAGSLEELLRTKSRMREDQARAVKGMVDARVARSVVDRTRVPEGKGAVVPALSEVASAVRYRLGDEIGRGGLGKVVEARDAVLDRTVALKLALEDLSPEMAERFIREARLAARLEHPAIVPVYDFGVLPNPQGKPRAFLAMKRVKGRDLAQVISRLAGADPEARREWTRGKLLRVFQDVCLGMAFAHDRGVIHRDLKPSNVMIGDYGETMIVDWGLAKLIGEPQSRSDEMGDGRRETGVETAKKATARKAALTMDGDVLGTPAYMSPEQAEGRIESVDARSDIYSLGAILYEILTLRPPVEGASVEEVLSLVRSGRILAPTEKLKAQRAAAEAAARRSSRTSTKIAAGRTLSTELDAICMKALSLRPEDRFQGARALYDEIQLFQDGVKQRERALGIAAAETVKAKDAAERHLRLRREARKAREEAQVVGRKVPGHADKSELWAIEDRASRLEAEAVEAFAEAERALTVALDAVRDHGEARRIRSEMSWARYIEFEEAGNTAEALLARRAAEQFNDGDLDVRLKGDGTLTLRVRAYPCRCLVSGRMALPQELIYRGYHPSSGRAMDGHAGAEGLASLETKAAMKLKVHGTECLAGPLAGADAWLWKYEEVGRLLIPTTPDVIGSRPGACPGPTTEKLPTSSTFGDSPLKPKGPGLYLGNVPFDRRPLPMGSYLLLIEKAGYAPIRVPISIGRCEDVTHDVTLFRPTEIPDGYIPIPRGTFTYQGDRFLTYSTPALPVFSEDIFVAKNPVTCREYAAFLNAIPLDEAGRRVPRELSDSGAFWPGPLGPERAERVEGAFAVPTTAWLTEAPRALRDKARRIPNVPLDWEEDWPAVGLCWEDAMAWCAWSTKDSGWLTTLLHELDWEKAARGPDRRVFPMGNHMDFRWANNSRSFPEGPHPCRVGDFPHDESPYGVRGLAGNSHDLCLNDPVVEMPTWRLFRGGYWTHSGDVSRATSRAGFPPRSVSTTSGIRPARLVRVPVEGPSNPGASRT